MNQTISSLGLASIVALSSGCAVLKKIDTRLEKFADALAAREEQRPDYILRKRGYLVYTGKEEVVPIQTGNVTNVSTLTRFLYAFNPREQKLDQAYLVVSKEYKDVTGDTFYEERQCVYPAGFYREVLTSGTEVLSFTFDVTSWEKGRYFYEWWNGMPPSKDISLFEGIKEVFKKNKKRPLMEGFYMHK
ncbi:MAG: hypothetical protein AABY00_01315 [Nanoarchaeota archaeon]